MDAILELDVQADGNGVLHVPVGQPYAHVHVTVAQQSAPDATAAQQSAPDATAARILAAWDEAAEHFEKLGLTEADVDAEIAAHKAERARLREGRG